VIALETVEDIHRACNGRGRGRRRLDALYFCPHRRRRTANHGPGCCGARPRLGLALQRSYFVGDHRSDLQAAWAAGAQALLVRTGLGARAAELAPDERERCTVCDDLPAAVEWILARERCGGPDAT
jgi:histidinol phosphatase-like enzyme